MWIGQLRLCALRLAKYSQSLVGYFLELPIGDFYEWVKVMNEEIEQEIAAQKRAAKKHVADGQEKPPLTGG